MARRLFTKKSVATICLFLTGNAFVAGCGTFGAGKGIILTAESEDFSSNDTAISAKTVDSNDDNIVMLPASRPVRLLLDTDWLDVHGKIYYPGVQIQFRVWSDDSVADWKFMETNNFVMRGDTIIIHPEELLILDYQLNGVNFALRARLCSAGICTDWIRLPQSIRFYQDDTPAPRRPRTLRLIVP